MYGSPYLYVPRVMWAKVWGSVYIMSWRPPSTLYPPEGDIELIQGYIKDVCWVAVKELKLSYHNGYTSSK